MSEARWIPPDPSYMALLQQAVKQNELILQMNRDIVKMCAAPAAAIFEYPVEEKRTK